MLDWNVVVHIYSSTFMKLLTFSEVQKPNVKEMGASIALVVIGPQSQSTGQRRGVASAKTSFSRENYRAIVSAGLSLMISFTLQTDFQVGATKVAGAGRPSPFLALRFPAVGGVLLHDHLLRALAYRSVFQGQPAEPVCSCMRAYRCMRSTSASMREHLTSSDKLAKHDSEKCGGYL